LKKRIDKHNLALPTSHGSGDTMSLFGWGKGGSGRGQEVKTSLHSFGPRASSKNHFSFYMYRQHDLLHG